MNKKVLIIYYSFSSQSRNILHGICEGLEDVGVDVTWEQVRPIEKMKFPIGSYMGTIKAMVSTFFRSRMPIHNLSRTTSEKWDLVILGGPTWSFQPSGPILSLIDREKARFFHEQNVLPVISCRSFWKMNYQSLRFMLGKYTSEIFKPIVFVHTIKEPWCTIGLFLKLAGRVPESGKSWISKYYPKYGHTKDQVAAAKSLGARIGVQLMSEDDVSRVDYPVPMSVRS